MVEYKRTLQGKMSAHKEHQTRAELAHQKELLNLAPNEYLRHTYQTRVHLLSYILEDSTTF